MSRLGEHWSIDGVTAAYITRGAVNGRYQVVFERPGAELVDIEGIHWLRSEIKHLVDLEEVELPEGYGFEVVKITYDSAVRVYIVELKTVSQYLGDVTGYQAQVTELEGQVDELTAQGAALAEENVTLTEKNAALTEKVQDLAGQLAEADELVISLYEAQTQPAENPTESEVDA